MNLTLLIFYYASLLNRKIYTCLCILRQSISGFKLFKTLKMLLFLSWMDFDLAVGSIKWQHSYVTVCVINVRQHSSGLWLKVIMQSTKTM